MTETELLARLVAFPTVTNGPNLEMISWVSDCLEDCGFAVTRVPSSCGTKAGLLARLGDGPGGVLLSAHSDVVPVAGQSWTTDPFVLAQRGDRLVGRGATDMKGFLACALALAGRLKAAPPSRPVMIALSWDEEIGCKGIPEMIGRVIPVLGRPELCLVGEPTSMRLCTGHKGKASYLATCRGEPGHSAMAPNFANALHLACDLIGALRREQDRLMRGGAQDAAYDMPCSTVHAGKMSGGVALNMVPELAEVAFEIRHLAEETAPEILARIAEGLPEGIGIAETGSYPGLAADPADPAIAALAALLPDPRPIKVAYGTEAGFFAGLGIPTVVCGPGTMKDGHQPDESIAVSELEACRRLLARLA
ncbi:acetylornithine deacetylase [Mangrovicoccus sp. HB161399]|uniref:acetylornithine deacetylase n=1 Tax=Mangrovicoccus sp. HB161399 TaxID=2720392 RepID=UPI001553A023|nr:acetylornithine deacetylase [Mangrovicoccus sp. HB161399]